MRHTPLVVAAIGALMLAPGAGSAAASDAWRPTVAVAPTGDAVAIWTENPGANSIVQAAARPAGGAWQPAVNLSTGGATNGQIAIGPAGDAVAVWTRSDGAGQVVKRRRGPLEGRGRRRSSCRRPAASWRIHAWWLVRRASRTPCG